MIRYNRYKYIYPPKPEIIIPSSGLNQFEKYNKFIAQPKLDGSCMVLFTNGKIIMTMNRHKQLLYHKMNIDELINLHKGRGWMVLCGEYMNKNKTDENNELWNNKFVIFDILVNEGKYLLKTTFNERYNLLKSLYSLNPVKKHLYQISENCFMIDSFKLDFLNIWNDITQYQMYEGLVLKNIDGKLENGTTEKNNTNTQIKCRKSTKNYSF